MANHQALAKLADLLDTVDKSSFEMLYFCAKEVGEDIEELEPIEAKCGTVACALGWGAKLYAPIKNESWDDFSRRVFDIEPYSAEWRWLFDASWYHRDNTPTGAAERIRYFLQNGI